MNQNKLKDAEYSRQYYLKHREIILAKKKEYYNKKMLFNLKNSHYTK